MNDGIVEHLKDLVRSHPAVMHSPYYSNPCSKECPVCNMDEELYSAARKSIDKDIRYRQYLTLREEFEE